MGTDPSLIQQTFIELSVVSKDAAPILEESPVFVEDKSGGLLDSSHILKGNPWYMR